MRFRTIGLIVAAVAILNVPTFAEEPVGERNIRVTFNVGTADEGKETVLKTYEMVVRTDGKDVSMNTGAQIPIPTTSFKVGDDGNVANPITSFSYQHVGFSTKVRAWFNQDGTISLRGKIEDSSVADKQDKIDRPFIQSMSQNFAVSVEDGRPLLIHRTDETDTRSLFIQIRADSMDAG